MRPETPRGHYVYAWLSGDDVVYVGAGAGRRAFRPGSEAYSVLVLSDALPKLLAHAIKHDLIRLLRPPLNRQYLIRPPSSFPWRAKYGFPRR